MTSSDTHSSGALVWFREDLRLGDNPALDAAVRSGRPVTALYVLDEETEGPRPMGAASRWWLAQSLKSLARDCGSLGLPFAVRRGRSADVVPKAAEEAGADLVVWNRRYSGPEMKIDAGLKEGLRRGGRDVESFNARLLNEPWEVASKAGEPFKVYSPYWRAARTRGEPRTPIAKPSASSIKAGTALHGERIDALGLEPTKPDWAGGMRDTWAPGEAGAHQELEGFLESGLKGYAEDRNRPDRSVTSHMSPHLRFGEVSPHQLWHAVERVRAERTASERDVDKFRSELGWREFNHHLLHVNPDMATKNFQQRFDAFPWKEPNPAELQAWNAGRTGFPIVDAAMRQLWSTGWMHNRMRMITASFLIKDLMVDWRIGEDWFWDTLVDADHANNPTNWQWVAGSGADAAPYFRVFNPILQGAKFDPNGDYVRRYVPELARMPAKHIHAPWEAPAEVLAQAGVEIGNTYPKPIVDHGAARERALAAFAQLKARTAA